MVNLKLARAISKRVFLKRIKTKKYQLQVLQLELHLTFTVNNIFVNFSNGVGNSFWIKTFGMIGYTGSRRKTRYALYYYGSEVGEYLLNFLKEWAPTSVQYKGNVSTEIPIKLILHSALSELTDLRYKRFMEGVNRHSIYFATYKPAVSIPYNGCRLAKSRRTRRHRFFR